jgi:hypothetical protein
MFIATLPCFRMSIQFASGSPPVPAAHNRRRNDWYANIEVGLKGDIYCRGRINLPCRTALD